MNQVRLREFTGRLNTARFDLRSALLEFHEGSADNSDLAHELSRITVRAQCALAGIGNVAIKRMSHIGFEQYFACDNTADWIKWKENVDKHSVPFSHYSDIDARIEAEIDRIEYFVDDCWESYTSLEASDLSWQKTEPSKDFKIE